MCTSMEVLEVLNDSCLKGYHVYRKGNIGDKFTCCRSNRGSKASTVAKLDRNGIVVGHIPQLLSKRLAILLDSKEGIMITGTITGLPREAPGGRWVRGGGLELPCEYVIRGEKKHRTAVAEALEEFVNDSDKLDRLRSDQEAPELDKVDPDDAMDSLESNVIMNITNIGTQGYPGTGKTSLLDLAMGKPAALTRNSTGFADPPSMCLAIKNKDSTGAVWENVTTEKMSEMLCGAMKKVIDEDQNRSKCSSSDETVSQSKSLLSSSKHSAHSGEDQATSPEASSTGLLVDITQPCPSPYSHSIFPELLKQLRHIRTSDVIFDSHWMMVTDCGGQPPFLDAAALFLRNGCFQIFSLKLNECLDEKPLFSYFINGEPAAFAESCLRLTNLQIIETFAKTVVAIHPPYTPSAVESPEYAKFAIVGTFYDEAHKCSESVEEKEAVLGKVLGSYDQSLARYNGQIILPINAIATDEKERKQSALDIQQLIHASGVTLKVEVKLFWFAFLLSLLTLAEKQKKVILKLAECIKIGKSLGMKKKEVEDAIQFFHDISLIMHFNTQKLKEFVIVNVKPVLDMVSRLISVSFVDARFLTKHYDIVLPPGIKELLQQHGRFNQNLLDKCLKFPELMTKQLFLDILEHVKVVAVIDGVKPMYFMPCALPYASDEQCVPHSSPPWVIRFRIRQGVDYVDIPLPVGYLPTLVVFLLTDFPSMFSTDRERRRKQYRNVINLKYKVAKGRVYFVEHHLQLEVYFTFCKEFPQECFNIRNYVLQAMSLAEARLCIAEGSIDKVDCFICSCGKDGDSHIAEYSHSLNDAVCERTDKRCNLYECSLWISSNSQTVESKSVKSRKRTTTEPLTEIPSKRPKLNNIVPPAFSADDTLNITSLKDVYEYVFDLDVSQFKQLGLQLGLLLPTLKRIADCTKPEDYGMEVMNEWLKQADNAKPTWNNLAIALDKRTVKGHVQANELRKNLKISAQDSAHS